MEKYINKIIQGDCLEVMRGMPDKCVDLVLTDPPYGIDIGKMSFTSGKSGGIAERKDYRGMANWDTDRIGPEYLKEIFRVSKNQIIFGGNYYTDMLAPTKSWIIWDKRVEDKYSNDFADCEMAWCSTGQSRVFRYLWSGMMQEDMKNKEVRHHPTQKPLELMKWCIEKYSEETDLILDPFAGSCTLAVAATNLKRNFICIEKEPLYIKICNERLDALTQPLF